MTQQDYSTALRELADVDERIVVMTAENRAPLRSFPPDFPRFIDVGIAEQTMVGMAAGLALRGRIPIVHALAAFLTMRAFEFIRTDVGIADLPVKLVGFIPGVLSDGNGPTHQAIEDIALMRQVPGMTICCPADGEELVDALRAVATIPGPAYIRYVADESGLSHNAPFRPGHAETVVDGADLTILTYGYLTRECVAAARMLREEHVACEVINLRSLCPIDTSAVLRAASRMIVTVEDHRPTGGLYSLVAEICIRAGVAPRIVPIGVGPRWFTPGRLPDVLQVSGLNAEGIARRIREAFRDESIGDARDLSSHSVAV